MRKIAEFAVDRVRRGKLAGEVLVPERVLPDVTAPPRTRHVPSSIHPITRKPLVVHRGIPHAKHRWLTFRSSAGNAAPLVGDAASVRARTVLTPIADIPIAAMAIVRFTRCQALRRHNEKMGRL